MAFFMQATPPATLLVWNYKFIYLLNQEIKFDKQ